MTTYPHRIRLRGPWECEPLARLVTRSDGGVDTVTTDLPVKRRVLMPCRWGAAGLHEFAGRVRFVRRFGYPGRLDAHERVWLTFEGVDQSAQVTLNGQHLGNHVGAQEPFEFEVTALLRERNELIVDVEAPRGDGGLWGEVAMEVRATAFLRKLHVWAESTESTTTLQVTGELIGTCERLLELYVQCDRFNVAYMTLEADPAGKPFALVAEGLQWTRASGPHSVRVELVNVSSVWYVHEEMIV
jgi:hypothetical protein